MSFKDLLFATFTYPDATPARALRSGVALASREVGALTQHAVRIDLPDISNRFSRALIDLDGMIADQEAGSAAIAEFAATCVAVAGEEDAVAVASLTCTAKLYEEGACVSSAARTRDLCLIAIGGGVAEGRSIAETVLFESGRPLLIFPEAVEVTPGPTFPTVAIAWDGGARAARAVADAMPLLAKADTVRILVVTGEKSSVDAGAADELVRHLATHRVTATVDEAPVGRGIGQTLVDYAATRRLDLLVMGGYGHARAREFILGGATSRMLADPPCPILLSH
ncbi:MAG: universal stress protein [Phenylobacterium sp.]